MTRSAAHQLTRGYGKVGKQTVETGALDTKRMETIDEEFLGAAKDFIQRQHKAGKPWFCYFNSTRMHVFTHLKKESQGKTELGVYASVFRCSSAGRE